MHECLNHADLHEIRPHVIPLIEGLVEFEALEERDKPVIANAPHGDVAVQLDEPDSGLRGKGVESQNSPTRRGRRLHRVDGVDPLVEPSEIVRVALVVFDDNVANLADGPRKNRHGTMLLAHFIGGHKSRPGHQTHGSFTKGQTPVPLRLNEVVDGRFRIG